MCKVGYRNLCEGNSLNVFSLWNSLLCDIIEPKHSVISRMKLINSRCLEIGEGKEIKKGLEFGKEKEFPLGPEITHHLTSGHKQYNFPDGNLSENVSSSSGHKKLDQLYHLPGLQCLLYGNKQHIYS